MEIKKYEIDERLAQSAKNANSFSDYKENEATNSYNGYLIRFTKNVEDLKANSKNEITAEMEQEIEYWCNRYSRKLAEAINKSNSIEAMCPSVMICGAGNFPVRKKQKQNQARENFWNKYGDVYSENNYYLKKISNLLNNTTIYSSDEYAIEKLQNKIADLQEQQQLMKDVNAYYRKNKTLAGCELLTEKEIETITTNIQYHSWYPVPFAPYELTNNNANIKRLQGRVAELTQLKERAEQKEEDKYIKVDGLEVVEDATDMRIRILFDDIPSAETRNLLKSNGFKWSPKNSAWQRQLTSNGIYATKQVLEKLKNNQYIEIREA